jgi:anti-sigma B factor antagonist
VIVTDRVSIQEARDGVVVVSPRGELDAYTTPGLRAELHRLVEEGSRTLVVDLTGVTFLDSSALGVLVGTLKRLREREGELRIVEPRPTVRRAFEVTSLDQILAMYPTREAALRPGGTPGSATRR